MLKISKEGMATVEFGDRRSSGPLPEEITISPAVRYGGIVQDEDGKPVEAVSVSILLSGERKPGFRSRRFMDVVTDAEGRWQTPPLPEDITQLAIRLAHPDYVSDPHYGSTSAPPMEKLRDRTGVMGSSQGTQGNGRRG